MDDDAAGSSEPIKVVNTGGRQLTVTFPGTTLRPLVSTRDNFEGEESVNPPDSIAPADSILTPMGQVVAQGKFYRSLKGRLRDQRFAVRWTARCFFLFFVLLPVLVILLYAVGTLWMFVESFTSEATVF
jgi:hypothetical protein